MADCSASALRTLASPARHDARVTRRKGSHPGAVAPARRPRAVAGGSDEAEAFVRLVDRLQQLLLKNLRTMETAECQRAKSNGPATCRNWTKS